MIRKAIFGAALLGAVTAVRMAALTPLESAPTMAGTCCTSTSFLAASTPTEGLV